MLHYQSYIIGLLSTSVLIYFLKPRAVRFGLIDTPDNRKQHNGNIPLIGGLAVFFGFVFSLFTLDVPLDGMYSFIAAGVTLIIVGVLDDFRELSARVRFTGQIIAALMMSLWGGVVLSDLGVLSFDGSLFTLGILAIPFTAFATVGVINALNMSDGVDGLSGSLTLLALLGLIVVAYVSHSYDELKILLLLASCIVAFLCFNFRHPFRKNATVFMGDAGSMFIGFALTWFFIKFSQGDSRVMSPVISLWFLALPLFDTVGIMLRRILKRRSPFAADREHFHHVLLLAGYSASQSVIIMSGLALLGIIVGLMGFYFAIPDLFMFYLFLGFFGLYFFGMMRAWKVMRFLHRSICRRRYLKDRRMRQERRTGDNYPPEVDRRVNVRRFVFERRAVNA